MPNLTWEEFKVAVDKKLEELKLPQSTEIWYVDLHGDCVADEVQVDVTDGLGISVWA